MEPEPGNPLEIEAVLNPAAVRGPDGELCLFPRLVAKGNYPRPLFNIMFPEVGLILRPKWRLTTCQKQYILRWTSLNI